MLAQDLIERRFSADSLCHLLSERNVRELTIVDGANRTLKLREGQHEYTFTEK